MTFDPPFNPNRSKLPAVGSILTLVVALVVLLGWAANIAALKSLAPNLPPMKPLTAIAFVFAGVGLYLIARERKRFTDTYGALLCGGVVFVIGATIAAEYVTGTDLRLNRFLVDQAEEQAARMSLHSALNFALVGISITLIALKRAGKVVRVFLAFVGLITTVAMLGLLYGAQTVLGLTQQSAMALHTAILFLTLSVSLSLKEEHSALFKILQSDGIGASMARRIIPVVIIVPPIIGLVLQAGFKFGLYDASFRLALTVALSMAVTALILFYYSMSIDKMDAHRRRIEADLADQEARYREMFDYSQGMICIHDLDGTLRSVNPAVVAATGFSADELEGRNIVEFLPEAERPGIEAFLRQIEHEGLSSGVLPIRRKDGGVLRWRYQSILVADDIREPYVIGHAIDVTELVDAQRELRSLSLTDELTGLYNRRGFLTLAEQQLRLERHSGTARGLTLMFADMDGLKKINDTLGHEAGSEAIQTLARVVKAAVRSGDLVARWGGDEFVILTIGAGNENLRLMSDRIEQSLDEYNATSGKPYEVACSIGTAPVSLGSGKSFEDIIAEADEAMYEEKKKRKAGRAIIAPTPPPVPNNDQPQDSYAWY